MKPHYINRTLSPSLREIEADNRGEEIYEHDKKTAIDFHNWFSRCYDYIDQGEGMFLNLVDGETVTIEDIYDRYYTTINK